MKTRKWLYQALLAIGIATATTQSQASVQFSVSFDDPTNSFTAYDARIASNILAAGAIWSHYLTGNTTIDLVVDFTNIPTASASSAGSTFLRNDNGINIFEQSAATKARTGFDFNGTVADAKINIGPAYLANELYFDSDPYGRSTVVPSDRTDAVSVFLHELTHVFGFNGSLNQTTGAIVNNFESTFDELTSFDGHNFFFSGTHAEAVYGGLVPLTFGNIYHFGNQNGPGQNLVDDLMTGLYYQRGHRYDLTALDLAVSCDIGLTGACAAAAAVPEPGVLVITLLGLAVGIRYRRRRH